MKTNIRIKTLAALAIAVAGALGTGMAQARPDVRWSVSIGLPLPHVYVEPRPVYVQPQPRYYEHYDRYERPVEYRYPTRWDRDADGIPDRYERNSHRGRPGRGWDRDRDGVPDRHDRRPGDAWRY